LQPSLLHAVSVPFKAIFALKWKETANYLLLFPDPTMALTPQDIARVAHLARLELPPQETQHTLDRINGLFQLVEQMAAVPTAGVQPLAHPAAVTGQIALRLRDDVASEPNQREASQVSAPAVERGLFLVPKVIE
jgi:aspartyl-tRNA(Asn)/glutamyl-tRNA(Gln) amidotransferase subunit C